MLFKKKAVVLALMGIYGAHDLEIAHRAIEDLTKTLATEICIEAPPIAELRHGGEPGPVDGQIRLPWTPVAVSNSTASVSSSFITAFPPNWPRST